MSAAEAGGWEFDRGALSTCLGLASIVTWLGAQSPQIYENFKRGSVEGLALPFLISWFVGDFTNFLGCVLTHQLPFQTYLAGYFLLVDVVLCSQFAYYSRIHPRSPVNAAPSDVERSNVFPLDVPEQANDPLSSSTPLPSSSSDRIEFDVSGTRTSGSEEPPHQPHGPDWERIIGRTSAWTCTTAYLTSRLPQIWQNFRRRSVEGLAMTLFLFAFIGNSLYVASILANPQSSSVTFLLESLPYLLGSGGTLCFDLMILGQSWLYSEKRRAR
ncbi:hypothetical protein RHOSPDRAFT_17229, partial [Rhodotorula sp. JG-1b]